jgi:hypothetical protein
MLRIPFELELSLLFLEGIYSYFVDVDGGECMIKPLAVAGIKTTYFVSLVYVVKARCQCVVYCEVCDHRFSVWQDRIACDR